MIVDNGDTACVHALKGIGPLEWQQPRMDITCLILLFREARSLAQSPTASEEFISRLKPGNSLAVQWSGFCTLTTEGKGSISNPGTKSLQKRLQHAGVGDLERRTGGRIHETEVEEGVPTEKPPDAKAQGLQSIQNLG